MPTGDEQLLTIDGKKFKVYVIKISRKVSILDKAANRTLNGDLYREIIGTYVNYHIEFGYSDRPEMYNKLWETLCEPTPFHRIILPKNIGYTHEFIAYIASVQDNIEYADPVYPNKRKFNGLSCDIIAKSPNFGNHK